MTLELLVWLLVIFVQTALLGITMYTLICLSDLENDFINPHDASERMNRCVVPELCLNVALAGLYIMSRHFLFMAVPLVLCAWAMRDYTRGSAFVDVTEIFRNTDSEKKRRMAKLALHVLLFVFSIFKHIQILLSAVKCLL